MIFIIFNNILKRGTNLNWIRRIMAGRYGPDHLSIFLMFLSIILSIIFRIIGIPWLFFISYIPLVWCIFRMFSRKLEVRSMENYRFMMILSPIYKFFKRMRDRSRDKTHKYLKCPKCKASLRLPKGKGKICITFPKCKYEFIRKT